MKTRILDAQVEFESQPYRKPMLLSSGAITATTEARTKVRVEIDGKVGIGRGSIYLSDGWSWPDHKLTHLERDGALRAACWRIAENLSSLCGDAAHPLELGLRLHAATCEAGDFSGAEMPVLARAMCASPFDAAIHDAAGQALERSAFDFYEESVPLPSADKFFASRDACASIRRTLEPPRTQLDAWLIVGANDSLDEEIEQWVREGGYRCFKLKLLAHDNAEDVARTVEVFQALKRMGVTAPRLSVDSNEGNPDADSVVDYLERLRSADGEAFASLHYMEQPTGRDIARHAFDWRGASALKPVMLDEGLTSLELLEDAVAQGWSGLALKTCKGHSFILVAAAWAREHGLLLAMQDLTNPGLAAIHSSLCAAHLPTINGIELNSPQYTPAANAAWLPRLRGLFEPSQGVHTLNFPHPVGVGSGV